MPRTVFSHTTPALQQALSRRSFIRSASAATAAAAVPPTPGLAADGQPEDRLAELLEAQQRIETAINTPESSFGEDDPAYDHLEGADAALIDVPAITLSSAYGAIALVLASMRESGCADDGAC